MGLNGRIYAIERRLKPAQKVVFELHIPPASVQTRAEHRAWSNELKRTVGGDLWVTFNIGGVDEDELGE